jgi:hypothetical protein
MIKKSLIFIGLGYLLFLVGMFFIGLGKFASLAFVDGWWAFTKDFASILGSFATVLSLPWIVWLYFEQRKQDRLDKWHELARDLLNELTSVLSEGVLLTNQLKINSLLYRLQSYIGNFNKPNNNDYLFALRTHLNQLFFNLEADSLFTPKDPAYQKVTYYDYDYDLPDLTGKSRDFTLLLATRIVDSQCYRVHEFGDYLTISFDKGFDPKILSQLVVLAQPICIDNFTQPTIDIS